MDQTAQEQSGLRMRNLGICKLIEAGSVRMRLIYFLSVKSPEDLKSFLN